MHRIREVIVVEGRYDKNTLSQVVDAVILETSGFGIFNDREKQRLLQTVARERGLIVLTDSDGAGFLIRNRIKGMVDSALVKHAYIPDVPGKERRKDKASREGKLGVEGMRPQVLLDALKRAGATFEDGKAAEKQSARITKADLYALGLSGREESADKRRALQRELGLPERLSASALLDVLNAIMDKETLVQRLSCVSSTSAENSAPISSTACPIS